MWVVYRLRPDLFVGKLKQVKYLTAFFIALMFFTLAGGFWIDRQQPPKPARIVAPAPVIKDTPIMVAPVPVAPAGNQEQQQHETVRRFFEIEDKK